MKRLLVSAILAVFCSSLPGSLWGKACVDWPRVMARYAIDSKKHGPIIVVEPFKNFTEKKEDDWLILGYRDLLASLLSTAKNARVRWGDTVKYDPQALKPKYIVGGKFLNAKGTLKVFIELKDGVSKQTTKILEVSTPYPDNAGFFIQTAEAAKEIGSIAGLKFHEKNFDKIRDATPSTRTYEYYINGKQAFTTYDPAKFDIAKIWYEQAKKTDFHSWLGYEGMIDLYTFLGLKAKQEGLPFTSFYQQAEQELAQMDKLAKRPPAVPKWGKPKKTKKDRGFISLTNRFLRGNAAYLRGVAAMRANDLESASENFRMATKEVPEDAVAWMKFASVLARTEKPVEAANARMKAREINNCLH